MSHFAAPAVDARGRARTGVAPLPRADRIIEACRASTCASTALAEIATEGARSVSWRNEEITAQARDPSRDDPGALSSGSQPGCRRIQPGRTADGHGKSRDWMSVCPGGCTAGQAVARSGGPGERRPWRAAALASGGPGERPAALAIRGPYPHGGSRWSGAALGRGNRPPTSELSRGSHFLVDATLAPGGSVIVAGGSDGFLRFWDTSNGRLLWMLQAASAGGGRPWRLVRPPLADRQTKLTRGAICLFEITP
jgi:hypothetical protein